LYYRQPSRRLAALRKTETRTLMALPFGETPGARDSRALAILAKTIYRELRGNGFHAKDVIALAGELLALVASDVRSGASAKRGD
jgi:hypothetical protein